MPKFVHSASHVRRRWRVVVGTRSLDPSSPSRPLAWHLADCQDDAHCGQGASLIATAGDPDGHCLIDGHCARCAELPGPVIAESTLLSIVP